VKYFKNIFIVCFVLILLFFGCSRNRVAELDKERLFSMNIGDGVESVGVLRNTNGEFIGPKQVLYRNGFFYLVDSVNQKVMKITTPGDVILVLSSGEETQEEEDILRTKQRRSYPFNQIGSIAVDNENNIYVEDKVLQNLQQKEEIDLLGNSMNYEENGEHFVSYIMKFDRLGKFLCRIGKHGVDTEPFYYIFKIDTDKDGNLQVITSDERWEIWTYYRFDKQGKLELTRTVSTSEVFNIQNMENTAFFVIDVFPSHMSDQLIYWISLYDTSSDTKEMKEEKALWGEEIEIENVEKSKKEENIKEENVRDLLYYKLLFYDLDAKKIGETYKWENRVGENFSSTEELLGFDGKANGFLWKYMGNEKAIITIFKPEGNVVARRSFTFDDHGIWTNLNVAVDGSVSAIKITDDSLLFYRWQSDKLISDMKYKKSFIQFIKEKIEEFMNANR